jgi:hypothetical protein
VARVEATVRGDDVSNEKTKRDEEIDPLMGGLQASQRPETGLAMKWRILIAVIVLAALVEIVRRQAY